MLPLAEPRNPLGCFDDWTGTSAECKGDETLAGTKEHAAFTHTSDLSWKVMTLPKSARQSSAARLERLPITPIHKRVMWILGVVFFFELGDLYTFAFAAPAILKHWNLSISAISHIVSWTFLGMFVGAVSGGWCSDRLGRKTALLLFTSEYSICSLLNAAVQSTVELSIARFLTGVGLSAMTVIAITYVSEIFPAKQRGSYQGWIMTIGLLGIPTTAYIARFTVPLAAWGWRLVFVWGGLGIVILLFANRLEESPRWYENRGDFDKADAVMERFEQHARFEANSFPLISEPIESTTTQHGLLDLLGPTYFSRTMILIGVWLAQTLGFYGFAAWVPTLLVAHGFSLVNSLAWSSAMTIGAVPGAIIAAAISDRWERKWSISIVALAIAVCGLLYGMTFNVAAIVIFGFLFALLIQTFAPLLYAYTPECYPTHIRNSGAGLAYGTGRLANVFGPLFVAFLFNRYGYNSVFLYIASMWLLVALILSVFGPKTKGHVLE